MQILHFVFFLKKNISLTINNIDVIILIEYFRKVAFMKLLFNTLWTYEKSRELESVITNLHNETSKIVYFIDIDENITVFQDDDDICKVRNIHLSKYDKIVIGFGNFFDFDSLDFNISFDFDDKSEKVQIDFIVIVPLEKHQTLLLENDIGKQILDLSVNALTNKFYKTGHRI